MRQRVRADRLTPHRFLAFPPSGKSPTAVAPRASQVNVRHTLGRCVARVALGSLRGWPQSATHEPYLSCSGM
jgi:hypothetical protein